MDFIETGVLVGLVGVQLAKSIRVHDKASQSRNLLRSVIEMIDNGFGLS
jgi:hypothetical protein